MYFAKIDEDNGLVVAVYSGAGLPQDGLIRISEADYFKLRSGAYKLVGDAFMEFETEGLASEESVVAQYEAALDAMLDGVAKTYRYADRTRLALRAAYSNQHQSLAMAFGTWMDQCNDIAKQCYLDVKAGTRAMPSLDEFLSLLPSWSEPQ